LGEPEIVPGLEGVQELLLSGSSPVNSDSPLPQPDTLLHGRFELGAFLGSGGMGLVYSGRDVETGNEVTIKTPKPGCTMNEIHRLVRESSLELPEHSNLVRLVARFIENGRPFAISEKISGRTLCEVLQARLEARGPEHPSETPWFRAQLAPQIAVRAIAGVARAVHLLHESGVVHRDLKPGNFVWHPDGRAVVIDFGLAFQEDGPLVTRPGHVGGTTAYMAPEQWRGKGSDARSDIFSLGASLWHLLTGVPPNGMPRSGELHAAGEVPIPLLRIVQKCMERSPRHRFESANQLADALERWLERGDTQPELDSTWTRATRWARTRRFELALGTACGFMLLATWLIWRGFSGQVDQGILSGLDFGSARAKQQYLIFGKPFDVAKTSGRLLAEYRNLLDSDSNFEHEITQATRRRAMELALGTGQDEILEELLVELENRGFATAEDYRLNASALFRLGRIDEALATLEMVVGKVAPAAIGRTQAAISVLKTYRRMGPPVGGDSKRGSSLALRGWPGLPNAVVPESSSQFHAGQVWMTPVGATPGDSRSTLLFSSPVPVSERDGVQISTADLDGDNRVEIWIRWRWNDRTGKAIVLADSDGRPLQLLY
jgi:serine/threonine protein kinase